MPQRFDGNKPKSATFAKFNARAGAMRHQSLNVLNKPDTIEMHETGTQSQATQAEKETNGDSSQAMLKSEVGRIQEFARRKYQLSLDTIIFTFCVFKL